MAKKPNKKDKKPGSDLVPVFTPALVSILLKKEKAKGAPLTEEEVLDIRDNSTLILLDATAARSMTESRGYEDLDPERTWEQWQKVRKKFVKG